MMEFVIQRETLLKPLQLIGGIVERRQTLPILANVLLELEGDQLLLIGTDTEVELLERIHITESGKSGAITVSARKLMDICRSLTEGADIELAQREGKLVLRSGRSCFYLTTLPATDLPRFSQTVTEAIEFTVLQKNLKFLLESTNFAMAQQDVRYYLNGMLWTVGGNELRAIATDSHRLALSSVALLAAPEGCLQIIVPRKAVFELSRLLTEVEEEVVVAISPNQFCVKGPAYIFTSKLIDARFPDCAPVLSESRDTTVCFERDLFKQALNRVAILAHDKSRGVCLEFRHNLLRITSNNPEQGEAEEYLDLVYEGEDFDIAFNVDYLMDALEGLFPGPVKLSFGEPNKGIMLENTGDNINNHVIMPMRL